ncbi:MAG: hypothetical protein QXK93_06815 [Candidatus Bathyarchaeia archaeon]
MKKHRTPITQVRQQNAYKVKENSIMCNSGNVSQFDIENGDESFKKLKAEQRLQTRLDT